MPVPSNWSEMSDAEKRQWADDQTNPAKTKSKVGQVVKPAGTKTVDEQIEEIRSRSGGYFKPRNQSTDHMN